MRHGPVCAFHGELNRIETETSARGSYTMMEIIYLSLTTLVASLIGTATGFGTSTVMVPVLLLFYPLSPTLLFVGIIHLFGDIWKMILFRRGIDWKIILSFGVPGLIMSYVGATISLSISPDVLKRILGLFLLSYVIFIIMKRNWKLSRSIPTAGTGGALSGLFAGVFGVGGAVRSAFLTAFDLEKRTFIFTSGIIAFIIDTTRIATYLSGGTKLSSDLMTALILCIPISLAGAYVAKGIISKIPQSAFRIFVAIFLALVALKYLFVT